MSDKEETSEEAPVALTRDDVLDLIQEAFESRSTEKQESQPDQESNSDSEPEADEADEEATNEGFEQRVAERTAALLKPLLVEAKEKPNLNTKVGRMNDLKQRLSGKVKVV